MARGVVAAGAAAAGFDPGALAPSHYGRGAQAGLAPGGAGPEGHSAWQKAHVLAVCASAHQRLHNLHTNTPRIAGC